MTNAEATQEHEADKLLSTSQSEGIGSAASTFSDGLRDAAINVSGGPSFATQSECHEVMAEFRAGKLSAELAFARISALIIAEPCDAAAVGSAIRSYKTILDGFDAASRLTKAAEHQRDISDIINHASGTSKQTPAATVTSPTVPPPAPDTGRREDPETPARKRGEASDLDSDDEEFDSVEFPNVTQNKLAIQTKRARTEILSNSEIVALPEQPWQPHVDTCLLTMSATQTRTRKLIDDWCQSETVFKTIYKRLMRAPGRPRFPATQVKRVLQGQVVDLDKVLASVSSVVPEGGLKTHLSDQVAIEIEGEATDFRASDIKVTTQAGWITAASMLVEFMLYVFGDFRRSELNNYLRHINRRFAHLSVTHHPYVIAYDKQVRLHIAESGDIAFDDFTRYADLAEANSPFGINSNSDLSIARAVQDRRLSTKRRANKSAEVCRNFNAGRCSRSAHDCQYRHVCSRCKSIGHTSRDNKCEEGTRKE